jgi:putative DNA primase/helicase
VASPLKTPWTLGIDRTGAAVTIDSTLKPSRAELIQQLPDRRPGQHGGLGAPLSTVANVAAAAPLLGWGLRYNQMTRQGELTAPNLRAATDDLSNTTLALFGDEMARLGIARDGLKPLVDAAAALNPYHPVLEWINARPWDGIGRLGVFHESLSLRDAAQAPLRAKLLDAFFVGVVAGLLKPDGVAMQLMLVLAGPQGCGKTRWVQALIPLHGAVRTGLHLDPTDKDSVFRATAATITELGELDTTLNKAAVSALKAFITALHDVMRRPYAPNESTYPRRTGFIGTVNGTGFLADDTGTRRFGVLNVVGCTLPEPDFMQQVWAEYLTLYEAGQPWHLDSETLRALRDSNDEHTTADPLRERILARFDWSAVRGDGWVESAGARWVSATEVCIQVGINNPTRSEVTRAGGILRSLNGGLGRKTHGGMRLLAVPTARRSGGNE